MLRFIGICIAALISLSIFGYGLYFGFAEMLVAGIIIVIEQVKAENIDATALGWAIGKIIFFEVPIAIGFIVSSLIMMVASTVFFGDCATKFKLKIHK